MPFPRKHAQGIFEFNKQIENGVKRVLVNLLGGFKIVTFCSNTKLMQSQLRVLKRTPGC